jgi:hypothetical protein
MAQPAWKRPGSPIGKTGPRKKNPIYKRRAREPWSPANLKKLKGQEWIETLSFSASTRQTPTYQRRARSLKQIGIVQQTRRGGHDTLEVVKP